ncbi:hypothetical protein SELSPUOL_01678 [Selenomonas sputigena ATCC 35185]|uniref:Uncharacterized protein n=1 Tax=Selenomonas sputigena (strain ATCC 35185 / DSM 20758 / CCUG 44933 / VPI D19B-28) TaxID=546271 RepID=C9LW26_SELS3|nr:hypothetical protein SELSPUOL_01678 [Selenomonas sputigena ATCC 35185]
MRRLATAFCRSWIPDRQKSNRCRSLSCSCLILFYNEPFL